MSSLTIVSATPSVKSGPRTDEQARAFTLLRELAAPARFRVVPDAEGFPIIPGRTGQIEWYCDGVDCHSCPLPGQFALAVWTDRPRLFSKLQAIQGVRRHQTGDPEARMVFPPEALLAVAGIIRARRKRPRPSPAQIARLRPWYRAGTSPSGAG